MVIKHTFSIKLPKQYNLSLTFYPSFTYPLYRFIGNKAIKDIGVCSGTIFTFYRDHVNIDGSCDKDVIEKLLGLWFDPLEYIDSVNKRYRDYILDLVNRFNGIRLAISPSDRIWVFMAVFLSKATNFHANTVKWVRKIASIGLNNFIKNGYRSIGNSFQLKQLWHLLNESSIIDLLESFNPYNFDDSWRLRRKLLRYKYIGVKTVDAFLLFATQFSFFTPIDRHYKKFLVQKLGLRGYREPLNDLCKLYDCRICPLSRKCLSYFSRRNFGKLSGWIQTLSYLAGNKLLNI